MGKEQQVGHFIRTECFDGSNVFETEKYSLIHNEVYEFVRFTATCRRADTHIIVFASAKKHPESPDDLIGRYINALPCRSETEANGIMQRCVQKIPTVVCSLYKLVDSPDDVSILDDMYLFSVKNSHLAK